MSRLPGDPHPRTRKPSTGFTSAAARLLLRHSQTEAANGESIEFFSALRKCLPDPHISGQNGETNCVTALTMSRSPDWFAQSKMKSCNDDVAARGAAQPADGKGKARRGCSDGDADEVLPLSSGIGRHDYDWYGTVDGSTHCDG